MRTNSKNHGREINGEDPWRSKHFKENPVEGIIGAGDIWKASGRLQEAPRNSRRPWGGPKPQKSIPVSATMLKSYKQDSLYTESLPMSGISPINVNY
jgi:hypothetical protein